MDITQTKLKKYILFRFYKSDVPMLHTIQHKPIDMELYYQNFPHLRNSLHLMDILTSVGTGIVLGISIIIFIANNEPEKPWFEEIQEEKAKSNENNMKSEMDKRSHDEIETKQKKREVENDGDNNNNDDDDKLLIVNEDKLIEKFKSNSFLNAIGVSEETLRDNIRKTNEDLVNQHQQKINLKKNHHTSTNSTSNSTTINVIPGESFSGWEVIEWIFFFFSVIIICLLINMRTQGGMIKWIIHSFPREAAVFGFSE